MDVVWLMFPARKTFPSYKNPAKNQIYNRYIGEKETLEDMRKEKATILKDYHKQTKILKDSRFCVKKQNL